MASIDRKACEVTRASILLFGALAAREPSFKIYKSGGCKLGNRSIRPHTLALEKFGVMSDYIRGLNITRYAPTSCKALGYVMYEAGDTPTENAIMAAVLATGKRPFLLLPQIIWCRICVIFWSAAGANIEGIGTTTLTITGVSTISSVTYAVSPDPVDAMAWISLAITTRSALTIRQCPIAFLELELEKLSVMGQRYHLNNERLAENNKTAWLISKLFLRSLLALPDKLAPRPFPGLTLIMCRCLSRFLPRQKGGR